MSKQSRLNKAKAEKAKAKGNQDPKQSQPQQHDAKRPPSQRDGGEEMARRSEESGRS